MEGRVHFITESARCAATTSGPVTPPPSSRTSCTTPAGGLLASAAIYTARRLGDGWILSTAIIPREAHDASGEIHDRMPVFREQGA